MFFLTFQLAFLTAGIGVGTAVWLHHKTTDVGGPQVDLHRLAAPFISAAQSTLQQGGVVALRRLLSEWNEEEVAPVYAVNELNHDLMERDIPPLVLERARQIIREGAHTKNVREIRADDGHRYLLFISFAGRPVDEWPSAAGGGENPPAHHGSQSPVIPIVAGICASLIFSAWLAWYFAKPIRYLRAAFYTFSQGNLDTRVGALMGRRRDELSDLGRHFDRMALQIGTLIDSQRRLLHEVSHELRSPLARLQTAIGLARQQPDKIDASLARVERESERLNELVDELLTISRLEAGMPVAREENLDFGELLAEIVEDARFEAEAKKIRIEFDDPGEIFIEGQVEPISRAIENTVRNALQHSPEGSAVRIDTRIDEQTQDLRLTVSDQGPGVAEARLSAIFEPFWRDESRQRKESVGLGLAIARAAMELHGGSISAHNRASGGLCVELVFPAALRQEFRV
jgi:two-component system OmpR family sensor kinase